MLLILTFFAGLVASYLVDTSAITVIGHRVRRVIPVSMMTNVANWASLFIVAKVTNWNWEFMAATAAGDILADFLVCMKWPRPVYMFLVGSRKKRATLKKIPITTA